MQPLIKNAGWRFSPDFPQPEQRTAARLAGCSLSPPLGDGDGCSRGAARAAVAAAAPPRQRFTHSRTRSAHPLCLSRTHGTQKHDAGRSALCTLLTPTFTARSATRARSRTWLCRTTRPRPAASSSSGSTPTRVWTAWWTTPRTGSTPSRRPTTAAEASPIRTAAQPRTARRTPSPVTAGRTSTPPATSAAPHRRKGSASR